MGFTHDDKAERFDPATVKVSSILIFACGRKKDRERFSEMFSLAVTQRATTVGVKSATGYWCHPVEQTEE